MGALPLTGPHRPPILGSMLENISPASVVCLALALVAVINVGLVLTLTRGGTRSQIRLFQRAVGIARDPWKSEREAMSELHERVTELEPHAAGGAAKSRILESPDPADDQGGFSSDHNPGSVTRPRSD